MKNRKVFTLLLTGMLSFSMGSNVYASSTEAAIADAQAQKQAAEEGLAQVQSSIGSLESKKQELESYLADLNAQYEDLTNSISELSIQAAEKEDDPKAWAKYYHDVVFAFFDTVRKPADELEKIVDAKAWPFPTYEELLFEQ